VEVLASRDAPKPVLNVSVQDLGVILETQELNDINLIDVREQNEWDGSCISKFTLKPLSGIREWSATASEGNYSHLPHSASLITAPT
jgi:rhodanese-related sulfurtransferase|tara:strand:- start:405 stop:665 length:261 start_codon:yes stop_codon:yes gene_type:complete